jgi:hypothetical protein
VEREAEATLEGFAVPGEGSDCRIFLICKGPIVRSGYFWSTWVQRRRKVAVPIMFRATEAAALEGFVVSGEGFDCRLFQNLGSPFQCLEMLKRLVLSQFECKNRIWYGLRLGWRRWLLEGLWCSARGRSSRSVRF